MKYLLILALCLGASVAQAPNGYSASKATTLAAAAEVVTVQADQDAGVRLLKKISFRSVDVTCTVACTFTLERDGTAATTTTLAPTALNKRMPLPTALAYSGSNVGSGTVLGNYSVAAGGTIVVNLAGKELVAGLENLTVRSNSITGTITINLQWTEE